MTFLATLATAMELAGACAIGYGLWLMFPPATFLFGGTALIFGGYVLDLGAMR